MFRSPGDVAGSTGGRADGSTRVRQGEVDPVVESLGFGPLIVLPQLQELSQRFLESHREELNEGEVLSNATKGNGNLELRDILFNWSLLVKGGEFGHGITGGVGCGVDVVMPLADVGIVVELESLNSVSGESKFKEIVQLLIVKGDGAWTKTTK
ncbi:hypothetical protein BS17DRAFT_764996 [Gyrodon lividus]|nr:hypothetical protein BS17DRAFT_764996 [Gyrodon lividus]